MIQPLNSLGCGGAALRSLRLFDSFVRASASSFSQRAGKRPSQKMAIFWQFLYSECCRGQPSYARQKNMKAHGNAEVTENPVPGLGAPARGLSDPGPVPLTISKKQNITIPMKKTLILTLAVLGTACLSASAADVKENWEKLCVKCHGAEGKGD